MNETAAATRGASADAAPRDTDPGDAASEAAPVVVAEDVRKSYGDVVALAGVDLRVESGEVFGLIGPNGAGKTTLVRALTGTTTADGELKTFGVPPRDVDPQRIGLLPQSFDPPERLTANELVAYYGGLYDTARDADAVLRDVGMAADAEAWYETLSGGQKRRTCVATAIVNDPDLLFLDEPTTGIDPAGRRAIHRLIERLAGDGTTVFLTSHAMDEVERLADRVALLRDGSVVAVGPPDDLIAKHGGEPRLDVTLDDPASDEVAERVAQAVTAAGDEADKAAGDEVDEAAASDEATVTSLPGGATVEPTADGLRILGVRPEAIGDAVDALDAAGVTFESLAWTEPSLEDVYLRLTGEEYSPREETTMPDGSESAPDRVESIPDGSEDVPDAIKSADGEADR